MPCPKTTCYCAFLISMRQSRAQMEQIFYFSESAVRALPSGRATIENDEVFFANQITQNLPDFEAYIALIELIFCIFLESASALQALPFCCSCCIARYPHSRGKTKLPKCATALDLSMSPPMSDIVHAKRLDNSN